MIKKLCTGFSNCEVKGHIMVNQCKLLKQSCFFKQ